MNDLYETIKHVLLEQNLASNQDVNDKIVFEGEIPHITLSVDQKASKVIARFKNRLKNYLDEFDFIITVNGKTKRKKYPKLWDKVKTYNYMFYYHSIIHRGFIVLVILFIALIIYFLNVKIDTSFEKKVSDASKNLLSVCALLSSLIITFVISKVLLIRQEKISRVPKIKQLSNKLSEFRRICDYLIKSHQFWQPIAGFNNYASSVAKQIDYNDVYYLDWNDDERRKFVNGLIITENYGEMLIKLYLQIKVFCSDADKEKGGNVFYNKDFPANYIYSGTELEQWQFLNEDNNFWYVFDYRRHDYENGFNFEIGPYKEDLLKSVYRFDPQFLTAPLDRHLLVNVSKIVENEVIPELTELIKKNERHLPYIVRYFLSCFTIILMFGVVIKTISDIFYPHWIIDMTCIAIVLFVIIHIFICLSRILNTEIRMNPKSDYY